MPKAAPIRTPVSRSTAATQINRAGMIELRLAAAGGKWGRTIEIGSSELRVTSRRTARMGPLIAAVCACLMLAGAANARVAAERTAEAPAARAQPGVRHFIEFRARPSGDMGHNYIVYGRTSARGRMIERHYAGLVPEADGRQGLIFPIDAAVRSSAIDMQVTPVITYRRELSAAEYAHLASTVRRMRETVRRYHVMFYNCNDFAIAIADALGLLRPPNLMPPEAWVAGLRALNGE
jgi:hypothetical protein